MSATTTPATDLKPGENARPAILGQAARLLPDFGEITFDPRILWATINRNRLIILAIIAASLLAGLLSILLANPVYRATASVQIDQQIAKVLGTEDNDQFQVTGDAERFLQTQVDVLKSRDLAKRVVDKLKLAGDAGFRSAVDLKAQGSISVPAQQREQAVQALQKAVVITLPRLSRVAQIGVDTHDGTISARIANAYADAFMQGNLQRKFDQSAYSRKFLADQLEQMRIKLEGSERSMVGFGRAAGLIEITSPVQSGAPNQGGGVSQSLVTTDLAQFNQSLAQAKAARIVAEQQWLQARAVPAMSLSDVLTNPAIQVMTQQLAQARVEYGELRQRLQEDHPTALQKAAAITSLERELQRQATSIKDSIRNHYEIAVKQEQSLSSTVNSLKGETIAERDRSIQYNILKREVDTNRALYEALLQRFKEVSAEAGVTTNNISLIDSAVAPSKAISPRPALNMALALLFGLAAAAIAVFAREQLHESVRTPEDVESRIGLPLLGVTPNVPEGKTPLEEFKDPKTQFSEAVHAIRISLDLATPNGIPRSLALTSARPSEGKSTLAYSLAGELAKVGKRVVLVDADMRAPTQHRFFNLPNKTGLSQVLAGQAKLADAITATDRPALKVITSGPLPPDPTMLLDGVHFGEVLEGLAEQCDLVIFDCPPVLGLADAVQIGSKVEGLLVVIEANDTRISILRTALKRLHASRIKIFGSVLSKFDAKLFGYGEHYGYYYSHYGDGSRT